ncbi:hypothetical protein [Streptomyces sp. NPDC021622]
MTSATVPSEPLTRPAFDLPLVIVFVFFQRQIISGVAHTGLAGQ